jgi:transcriptional repressor NF-X1
MVKNQQCWLVDIRCGEICGKKLRCGYHFCRKPCHRSGECEDANGQACQQPCGKEKKVCGHPDEAPCHAPYPCKEEKPCASKMFITCECQAQKQEVRCGASKSGEGNSAKTLPCNDECARLERNRKLAVALNIDQSTHVDGGDHIPFSTETLNLFASHPKWGQTQEREFRVFAAAEDEKRLRFNPMQASQRAFIHALADDFGLDSESVDPEPHRHVMVWKTPRFVSAPNKTLADALRLRQQALRSANVSDTEGAASAPKSQGPAKPTEPFNSFVIKNPRFALTLDEVRTEVAHVLSTTGPHPFVFDIEFLPSEEVVLKANTRTLTTTELERLLQNLRAPLTRAIASRGFGSTQLCHTDTSLNITRLESDAAGGDGWSRVAAKKVAPRMMVSGSAFVGTNSFAALGGGGATGVGSGPGKVTFAKKKLVKATKAPPTPVVVDDWEAAEAAEEEREKPSGAAGDAEPASTASAVVESAPADQAGPAKVAVAKSEDISTGDHHAEAVASAGLKTTQEVNDGGVESSAAAAPEDTAPLSSPVVANADGDIDVEEGDEDPSSSHGVRLDAA